MKIKKQRKSVSSYKKDLDKIFSKYIRARDKGQCYTCPKKDDPKRMQCGHFSPRQYLSTRWDEVNCHCQCYACNMLYNGQPTKFAQRLIQDYGEDIINVLERNRHIPVKLDEIWYLDKIMVYENKLKDLGSV